MALLAKYQRYLAQPTADALAANAAINYIPTLSTITGSVALLKHLSAQAEQLTKKSETFLNVIESTNSLCVETQTTIEFLNGGGAYLPGMDDNFLADKVVTMLIVHIVTFDTEKKIQQIRLLWDQGSLLKSLDVIGRSGRNWPLHDGTNQARLVASSASMTPSTIVATVEQKISRRRSRAGTNGESQGPLNLFSPRTFEREDSPMNGVAPRESAKPPPRDLGDLFVSGEPGAEQTTSPTKERENFFKTGAGKNFTANRLFDENPEQSVKAMGASIKTNPEKFNHFDLSDTPVSQPKGPTKVDRNAAQWDFADFATPMKKPGVKRAQDARHFGMGDDEGDTADPPADRHVAKARPDASAHFSFEDLTPLADRQQAFEPQRAATGGRGGLYEDHITDTSKPKKAFEPERAGTGRAGLYEDHITDRSDDSATKDTGKVLGNITNLNQHLKTFEPKWTMQDNDQTGSDGVNDENGPAVGAVKNMSQAKERAAKMMESTWNMYDESPQQPQRGIKIAGNGMGSRKENGWWDF